MDKFNRCVFATLTYARDTSRNQTWLRANNDFNRFIQRVKRTYKNQPLEYLRCFEHHRDGYPHTHALLIFSFNCRDRKHYLVDSLYRVLKSNWIHGNSDFQSPMQKGNSSINYILKYLGKSSSTSNLWSQILTENYHLKEPKVNDLGYPIKPPPGENVWKLILIPNEVTLLQCTLKWKRIKLLMWSRNFIKEYKNLLTKD